MLQAPSPMQHDAQSRQQELPFDPSTQQDSDRATSHGVGSKPSVHGELEVPLPPGAADLGHPDRRLELAGLNALLKAPATPAVDPVAAGTPATVTINWGTHKKEGMRLKRLMEESPDGANFPHMVQMWNGSAADPLFFHLLFHEYVLSFKVSVSGLDSYGNLSLISFCFN